MDLDRQLQLLIDDAPNEGALPLVMEKAIAPVLEAIARQLQHRAFQIRQSTDGRWVISTIAHQQQSDRQKRVAYAFASLEDATTFTRQADPDIVAVSVPVTHVLFQLYGLSDVDSVVFFDTPGDLNRGLEIERATLHHLIQKQLQQVFPPRQQPPSNLA